MKEIRKLCRVKPGRRVTLKDFDPGWTGDRELQPLGGVELKTQAKRVIERNLEGITDAQERLLANDVYSVLIVLQAIDAAGKDSMIKHVMSGLNPSGCQVFSFKRPSDEELDHNFLWRYTRALPERGRIGIFNRSYYEETLVVRVHPEILARQRLPPGRRGRRFWAERFADINAFERHLVRNGTLILKFFLNLSKTAQKQRFLERLDTPDKQWKFSIADLEERKHWDAYQAAFAETLSHTSTRWAPWWVIPSDNQWISRSLVSTILADEIKGLKLERPQLTREQQAAFADARAQLLREDGR
jgi:PPK2 family polyphosphate:nucleotide phosphotransferase